MTQDTEQLRERLREREKERKSEREPLKYLRLELWRNCSQIVSDVIENALRYRIIIRKHVNVTLTFVLLPSPTVKTLSLRERDIHRLFIIYCI